MDITEENLVAEIQLGNIRAWGALYDTYAPLVVKIISQHTQNEEESEELLLRCFMQIKANLAEYDASRSRVFTWILQCVQATIKDALSYKTGGLKNQADNKYVIDNTSAKDLDRDLLLDMALLKGCSYSEIADEKGISREEVMVLIRKEINQLKKSLK